MKRVLVIQSCSLLQLVTYFFPFRVSDQLVFLLENLKFSLSLQVYFGCCSFTGVTIKALLSPREANLISDLPEGGLFQKSSDKDIFDSISTPLSNILWNRHIILWHK